MPVLKSLSLFYGESATSIYRDKHIVGYRGNEAIYWQFVCERQKYWLQYIAQMPVPAVAVQQSSGIEFVAALLATWQLGKIAVVPGSTRRSQLNSILGENAMSKVHDCENFVAPALSLTPKTNQNATHSPADLALIIYTSGSSGAPQACDKTFIQLDAELLILEQCWGDTVADSLFLSSVSRHHMYGLPFSLLWPLCRGNAFVDKSLPYMESIDQLPSPSFTLITSPVQLANLPPALDWPHLAQHCAAVFSAGAPLDEAAAKDSLEKFGLQVNEIYGSTETGAIAQRQQLLSPAWQCLPETEMRIDPTSRQIEINSVAAGTTDTNWLALSDKAEEVGPQQFMLKGRSDQIVKVGAKRVSLSHINGLLASHPLVREARTVILNERKSRIGAVLCLTSDGNRLLTDQGRNATNKMLSHHLGDKLESIARPRYWRYLSSMPSNTQGKVPRKLLEELFYSEHQPRLPELVSSSLDSEGQEASFTLFVPHQLRYFNGHFPGNAVLPGVVQISWVLHFAQQTFSKLGVFQRLEVVKFQQVIRPGDTVRLKLRWDPHKYYLQFVFDTNSESTHSSGRIGFKPHDE